MCFRFCILVDAGSGVAMCNILELRPILASFDHNTFRLTLLNALARSTKHVEISLPFCFYMK